ncbi:MAG: DNA repair protein RecO [Candidatus Staskawiczbacteria bacterium]|nr:DNA repair protein RecO [Candidatus Staskawiczbacteria bacterium]
MTVRYRTSGFVIGKKDRFESDRVFTVFTQDFGKLEIKAKAIRKIVSKLRGGIDFLCLSEIEFIQGKNFKTLTDAVLIKKFINIEQNLEKLETAGRMAGLLDNFIKGEQKDEEIFSLFSETLEKLENQPLCNSRYALIYRYFFWNFVSFSGYLPELYKCAVCQGGLDPSNIHISCMEGGVVCHRCLKPDNTAKKITQDIVKIMRIILKNDWNVLLKLKIDNSSLILFENISEDYYSHLKEK